MKITAVDTRVVPFSTATWLDEERISSPLSWFPRFAERRSTWRGPGADLVWVRVRAGDELVGIGQSRGGTVTEAAIRDHLTPLLLGQDAASVASLGEQLKRALGPYAHGFLGAMAVSAVELALWDLNARAMAVPLYRLFGGHGEPLRHYVTIGSAELIDEARELLEGAIDVDVVKVPMAFGPADGSGSVAANVARVEKLRAQVPPHVRIAVDCFASWDVAYAARFSRACEGLGLAWIEEPLGYDDVVSHLRLRDALDGTVQIATGEHLAGVKVAEELITRGAVDVIQTDVTWCGGIGIARTIASVAAEHGVTFAPHASTLQPWALHLLSACAPDSLAETLVLSATTSVDAPRASGRSGVGLAPADLGFLDR
nr:mandelate racemase/muconate lactonizing enzyme family protein [Microbacterium sp. CFH 90308]